MSGTVTHADGTTRLTERGRQLCSHLTKHLYDSSESSPYETWKQLTALYGFGWSVGSGNRVAGRLPSVLDGERIVAGPHDYVLKIEFGVDPATPRTAMSNWVEAIIYEQARDRGIAHRFAPVVDHADDYQWLVMEEVETIGYDYPDDAQPESMDQQEYERRVAEFERELNEAGLGLGIDDEGQIGIARSGSIVALDYEHVTDETSIDQKAWVGSYSRQRGERLTAQAVAELGGRRDRLRRITTGANGSVTGLGIRSRLHNWR